MKESPFPISEEEWRKIVAAVERMAESDQELADKTEPGNLFDFYEGMACRARYILDFFHWWERERGEEDGK